MRKLATAMLAVGVTASLFGCSKTRSDDSISNDIKAGMFSDAATKSANINVVVKDGTVTLTGAVPDENTRYEAFKIAKETPGVVNVQDQMSLPEQAVTSAEPAASPEPVNNSASASRPARKRKPENDLPGRPLAGSNYQSPYGPTGAYQDAGQQEPAESQPAAANQTPPAPAPTPAPAPAATAPERPQPPQVRHVNIPGGTPVHIQMIDSIDSAGAHAGDIFHASLASPITVDGESIVPAGTDVYVKLTNSSSAGRMTGRSELTVQLARLDFQGKSYDLSSDDYQVTGKSRGTRTAETVGIGAAIGAALGGIFGGGKGAAIGAGVGGGGGAAAEAATKGQQVHIASESKLDFTLQQPITIGYTPHRNSSSN
jgi:hypothetical protein